ncbi:MAG: 2,3-bisphosphoglycerate-independent phosphoglycerate mutase [Candidatus Bathyarchaeota archaeon]|nr:2,3-bisphosphoglycerate-independent phosphoglycerate mutase [Candidatus Bathyarchaeota archaeon]
MKAVLIIADGMADRPVKELGWKTPLEFARKPSLNHIAETGICGILDPIAPGIPPGSDTATLALLGYDAPKIYSGRGALEALGSNVKILPGDVALRCNFATVSQNQAVLDRRAGRIENKDSQKLAESLSKVKLKTSDARFLFKSTIQHRAVLVLRGSRLSAKVSDSDPGITGEKVMEAKPLDGSPEAKLTAKIVNTLMHEFHKNLTSHTINEERIKRGLPPANMVLCRGAGTLPNVKSLVHIYGIKAACVAATPLVKGVCKAVGMKAINVPGATGTLQTDYLAKARATSQALRSSNFVLLHVKATDVASHDGKVRQKVEAIEKLDDILSYFIDHIDLNSVYLAVTADHTTSSATGNHEGDPVPIAITGPQVRRDSVKEYDERSCAGGGLHRIRGMDLMPILMNLLGKTSKFGA